MSDWASNLLPVFWSGVALGIFYFAGLWFTVRRLPAVNRVGLWMVVSFLVRNLIVLAGFYVTMNGQWQRVIVTLIGFLVVRTVFVMKLGGKVKPVTSAGG